MLVPTVRCNSLTKTNAYQDYISCWNFGVHEKWKVDVVCYLDTFLDSAPISWRIWKHTISMSLVVKMIFAKRGNLGLRIFLFFQWCKCLFNQCLSKFLKSFNCIWLFSRVVLHELLGVNGMIWFLMLFNGQWREHTKFCGTPYLTMVDLSGNRLSRILFVLFITNCQPHV